MTKKVAPLHVRLTWNQISVLSTVAIKRDIKVSELVREILDHWVAAQIKRDERFK
jgi:hypothetical protein